MHKSREKKRCKGKKDTQESDENKRKIVEICWNQIKNQQEHMLI